MATEEINSVAEAVCDSELLIYQDTRVGAARQVISTLFCLAVAIFVGVPIWLRTTASYQVPLPSDEISTLIQKPIHIGVPLIIISFTDRVRDTELSIIQSKLSSSSDHRDRCGTISSDRKKDHLSVTCTVTVRTATQEEQTIYNGINPKSNADFGLDQMDAILFGRRNCLATDERCRFRSFAYIFLLFPANSEAVLRSTKSSSALDSHTYIRHLDTKSVVYMVFPEGSAAHTMVGRISSLMNSQFLPIVYLKYLPTSPRYSIGNTRIRTITEAKTRAEFLRSMTQQLSASTDYDVTLTLLVRTAEGASSDQETVTDWPHRLLTDPSVWLEAHVEQTFRSLAPFVRIEFSSQRLHAVDIEKLRISHQSENGTYRYYTQDDLSDLINQLESYLGSSQSAYVSGHNMTAIKPGLHLIMLFSAAINESRDQSPKCSVPLRFRLPYQSDLSAAEKIIVTDVAMVPQWGGLISIDAPSSICPLSDATEKDAVLGHKIVTVIRSLLGLLDNPSIGVETLSTNLSFDSGFDELSTVKVNDWFLRRSVESLLSLRVTFASLMDTLERVPNLVINEEVANRVIYSVRVWEKTLRKLRDGSNTTDLGAVFAFSQDALQSANSAYFDYSLLRLLYFQDDQKYGIYVPLFVPIAASMLTSTLGVIRLLKKHRKIPME